MRTFEYRLYPTEVQYQQLVGCLVATRTLYNEMLECTKSIYTETGYFAFKYDLTTLFKGRGDDALPATVIQTLADRLDKSLRRYLDFKKHGLVCGFPRFKTPNHWHSIQLRQYGKERDSYLDTDGKHLHVPSKLGKLIKIKLHRPIEGVPKTCYLVLRADRHWYALIVCDVTNVVMKTLPSNPQEAVGLDVGLRHFLADSEGRTVQNPRCLKNSLATLRRKQQILSRRKKGSRRRAKAARSVAQTHLKVSRQRRDFLFKTAKPYAEGYRHIYVEDLNVEGMGRHPTLARSIHDASWSEFFTILTDKAESAGHEVVKIPAHYTSQKCSSCGELVAKSLSVRTHVCPSCGLVADRDVNAARNILKAGARPSELNGEIAPRALRSSHCEVGELSQALIRRTEWLSG